MNYNVHYIIDRQHHKAKGLATIKRLLKDYTIQDVHDWKVGDIIPLHYNHESNITLTYRNENETYTLAKGMVGQQKNKKAIKVSDEVMHIFLEDLTKVLIETDVYTKINATNALTYVRANKDIIRTL